MRLQQGFRQFTKVHEMNNNSSIQLNMEIDDTKLSCQQKSIMENFTTAHECHVCTHKRNKDGDGDKTSL